MRIALAQVRHLRATANGIVASGGTTAMEKVQSVGELASESLRIRSCRRRSKTTRFSDCPGVFR